MQGLPPKSEQTVLFPTPGVLVDAESEAGDRLGSCGEPWQVGTGVKSSFRDHFLILFHPRAYTREVQMTV